MTSDSNWKYFQLMNSDSCTACFLPLQVDEAGHEQLGHLGEEDHRDGVVAVGGGAVPGGRDQHALGHEHHHVGQEDHEAGPGREELVPCLCCYHYRFLLEHVLI